MHICIRWKPRVFSERESLEYVISLSEECDDCNSTRESRMLDMEEGVELKNKNDSLEKISISSCNFFMGNKGSFIKNGKVEKIKKKHKDEKKIKIIDIINCPLDLHTNFISMILFIIGSTFFLFPKLYVSGCIIFAIACALCLYSNLIGVIRTNEEKKIEYYGYICYVIGCVVFIVGSIYCCFKDDYFAVLTFIIGSFYFLVGALFFIYAIDFNNIKNVNWKIIVVRQVIKSSGNQAIGSSHWVKPLGQAIESIHWVNPLGQAIGSIHYVTEHFAGHSTWIILQFVTFPVYRFAAIHLLKWQETSPLSPFFFF
ncbi:hypothetical protein POVWA2_049390 [Plasmodium ovale wallikeri]|uniref:YrhK domain-containing protein n=1 Tax=Plasmodium ovale wallikeri TaxID=864142 RepID=A0A1A8ZMQ6_PLAOA|nr:hypothetical protein POVWA2_049390 [Plasmodium ovale wallikeri]